MWEKSIRSAKRDVMKIVRRASLNFAKLSTFVTEIESGINCRPLTYIYGGIHAFFIRNRFIRNLHVEGRYI